jgi:hypothetical protein
MLTFRPKPKAVLLLTATALAAAAAAPWGASAQGPPTVGVAAPPNVSIGDTVTFNGVVASDGVPVPGIDVTVRLYTLPSCASGSAQRAVLTTAADGTFTFTETIAVTPPLSYGFVVGLSQDPTRAPDFVNRDSCVTLQPNPKLSGKAEGDVAVNGKTFTSGVIAYGSLVDVGAGGAVKLATDAGKFNFFPATGATTSFIPVRVPLPTKKGQKRQFLIELRLVGGNFSACPKATKTNGFRVESAKKPPPQSLWGNGKGKYRTTGRYSSATVSGTKWLVQDVCGGTLTVVTRGVVVVRDFTKKKTVRVSAGHRYLATP